MKPNDTFRLNKGNRFTPASARNAIIKPVYFIQKIKSRFLTNTINSLIMVLGCHQLTIAQAITVAPTIESTITGVQWGINTGYNYKSWSTGAFYLRGEKHNEGWSTHPIEIYGIYASASLMRTERISFQASLRAGFANRQFFVVIPGLETNLKVNSHLSLVVLTGWRYGHASIGTSIKFTFYKQKL